VNISEGDQYYSAWDHKVHQDARPFYVDNWIWDMYRTLQPLQLLLNPEVEADQIQSYVRMYQQSGWMPSFAVLWGDHACMTGNHAAAWIADAWFKGVRNFDVATAYQGVRKNSLEATLLPWRNGPQTSLDVAYAKLGYFPALWRVRRKLCLKCTRSSAGNPSPSRWVKATTTGARRSSRGRLTRIRTIVSSWSGPASTRMSTARKRTRSGQGQGRRLDRTVRS